MSAGPATKMHTALLTIAETDDGRSGHHADRAIRGIEHPTLEAMDAAAQARGAQHPDEAVWPLRFGVSDGEGSPRLRIQDSVGGDYELVLAEESQLLRHLLEREIRRRKEAGNG